MMLIITNVTAVHILTKVKCRKEMYKVDKILESTKPWWIIIKRTNNRASNIHHVVLVSLQREFTICKVMFQVCSNYLYDNAQISNMCNRRVVITTIIVHKACLRMICDTLPHMVAILLRKKQVKIICHVKLHQTI